MEKEIAVVFDIGGTKLESAVINSEGKLIEMEKEDVPFAEGKASIEGIFSIIDGELEHAGKKISTTAGIGISVCGLIDKESGDVVVAPNLHWYDVPLTKLLRKRYKKPVFVETDTKLAALGEATWGAGKGHDNFAWVTLGTGFGGSFFLNGKIFEGERGFAGAFGHNTMDDVNGYPCGCGRLGCLETFASGRSLARNAQAAVDMGHVTKIREIANGEKIRAEMVFEAEKMGDETAKRLIEQLVHYTAIGIGQIINILDLNLIIMGGGLIKAGEQFLNRIRAEVKNHLFCQEAAKDLKIITESLPNPALFGAASMVFMHTSK
jgi:glucokinase